VLPWHVAEMSSVIRLDLRRYVRKFVTLQHNMASIIKCFILFDLIFELMISTTVINNKNPNLGSNIYDKSEECTIAV